ncbi:uncharacterized protein LOC143782912 [Ranitomeya variabilis]|uniref:uncharacterized protein LOC143782912 n=1 Tax=Ranitomeya variabilis TaxID=490064 RepID=UPI0040575036
MASQTVHAPVCEDILTSARSASGGPFTGQELLNIHHRLRQCPRRAMATQDSRNVKKCRLTTNMVAIKALTDIDTPNRKAVLYHQANQQNVGKLDDNPVDAAEFGKAG